VMPMPNECFGMAVDHANMDTTGPEDGSPLPPLATSRRASRYQTAFAQMAVLLPLLALYLTVALVASSPTFAGDESGYVTNATRMLRTPTVLRQDIRLWWGPGYPLVLVPFIVLRFPWIVAKCVNAAFLFGAIVYFFRLTRRYLARNAALLTTLSLGLYPPFLREVYHLVSENLVFLLVCGFMFHFCAVYNNPRLRRVHVAAASLYLAYLALTKVFFGYVITVTSILWLGMLLWRRMPKLRDALVIFLLALVWCVPYLCYTYSLTGRMFYWGTSGGLSLYCMSTPDPTELGSWFSAENVKENSELAIHREFFARLEVLSDVERDDALRKQAIYNITHHPAKYLHNWAANVGRLLFSYPYSFTPQRLSTYFYMAPNTFVVVLFLLSVIPSALRTKAVPFELWALLIFALIALAGSTLLSAFDRQFSPLVPVLCLWMGFVYTRVIRIDLCSNERLPSGETLHSSLMKL
jgi:hypothetical protein